MNLRATVRIPAFAIIIALVLCSCGRPSAIKSDDSEKLTEFGNALVSDLKEKILPKKDKPEKLVELGYVLQNGEKSYGMDELAGFSALYNKGGQQEVTMIFADKSFVVSRIVFVGDKGYYFRYEYDAKSPEKLAVSGQIADTVELKYQEKPPKWTMTLGLGKKQIAMFEFKNPQG